jgi:hypothetical protein
MLGNDGMFPCREITDIFNARVHPLAIVVDIGVIRCNLRQLSPSVYMALPRVLQLGYHPRTSPWHAKPFTSRRR